MWGVRNVCRWACGIVLCTLLPCCVAYGADSRDLVDLQKLKKELKLSPAQQDSAKQKIEQIRKVLETFEWDYAKMTCEAAIWKGDRPSLDVLKERKKKAYMEVENLLRTFREGLDKGQQARLDKMMKGWDRLLDLSFNEKLPFYYVDTRPIFNKLENDREVPYTTFTDPPSLDPERTYADVLKAWTTRTYLSNISNFEEANRLPGIAEVPDIGVRTLPGPVKGKLVQSPLIVVATLMSPDLIEAEIRLLHKYYNPEGQSLDSIRTAYQTQNRVGDAILIRLKMSTPNAAPFLAKKNWVIYLEDKNGMDYEPIEVREEVVRPIEAIKLEVPGATYEVTDVFGNYYPYIPGEKTYLTEQTQNVTYVGNEALVKVFFPVRNLREAPVVTPESAFLRLIIKPADGDAGPTEAEWRFKKQKKS
ncbi:MAG: hypothetical protein EXS64_17770 [Candidatus Latescibacteria bacterium]|nr:hypothetical protein [Candidatus Latescibacterota bacterium]